VNDSSLGEILNIPVRGFRKSLMVTHNYAIPCMILSWSLLEDQIPIANFLSEN
jgi:hypothetical protein